MTEVDYANYTSLFEILVALPARALISSSTSRPAPRR